MTNKNEEFERLLGEFASFVRAHAPKEAIIFNLQINPDQVTVGFVTVDDDRLNKAKKEKKVLVNLRGEKL